MPLMNHSASFVLSTNCLDKCPKCGQNVCEHTSVADAINLHNSVSQDFSTYSSDSSLIKQLFHTNNHNRSQFNNANESSTALAKFQPSSSSSASKGANRISMSAINKLSESFFLSHYHKQQQQQQQSFNKSSGCNECNCMYNRNNNFNPKQICYNGEPSMLSSPNSSSFMPCFNLRPLSCQVMIIDNETTDKLLKDFFDASQSNLHTCCPQHGHLSGHKNQPQQSTQPRYSSITGAVAVPETCTELCAAGDAAAATRDENQATLTKTSSGLSHSINNKSGSELPLWHSSPINKSNNVADSQLTNCNSSIKLVDDRGIAKKATKAKEKSQKKKKFSNFRLFLKNSSLNAHNNNKSNRNNNTAGGNTTPAATTGSCDKQPKKVSLKSSALVNCLTSSTSSSSSSCEELRHKLFKNKSSSGNSSSTSSSGSSNNVLRPKKVAHSKYNRAASKIKESNENDTAAAVAATATAATDLFAPLEMNEEIKKNRNDSKLSLCKSIISLSNSNGNKQLPEDDDDDAADNHDYNEIQNIELCPIVISDIDSEFQDDPHSTSPPQNHTTNSKSHSTQQQQHPHPPPPPPPPPPHFTNCNNNYNSNNFNNNNIINNHNNTTNINNISTIISVPLNNYLFYNYEKRNETAAAATTPNNNKKENEKPTMTKQQQQQQDKLSRKNSSKIFSKSCVATAAAAAVSSRPLNDIYTTTNGTVKQQQQQQLNNNTQCCYQAQTLQNKNRREPLSKHRLSYFSTCSSSACGDENETTTGAATTTAAAAATTTYDQCTKTTFNDETYTTTGTLEEDDGSSYNDTAAFTHHHQHQHHHPQQQQHRYHSMSIVFIIMGLFTVNFFQEYFVMFYYFNTEQFYWLVYSVIGLFTGQTLTLILSLLTEIDLLNSIDKLNKQSSGKTAKVNAVFASPSTSLSSPISCIQNAKSKQEEQEEDDEEETNDDTLLTDESGGCGAKQHPSVLPNHITHTSRQFDHDRLVARAAFNQELYLVFKNPFCKLFLLVPGFLSISVYIQFFKHVFNYRKSSGHMRFKLEFQLALYLFYNGIFHSLPLALINSCYFATTTTTYSLSSYYSDLLSIFSLTSYGTSSSSSATAVASGPASTAIFVDDLNMERRNQLVLLLVSIFISISIGICLFTTYFELMKQMNYMSLLRINLTFYQCAATDGLSAFAANTAASSKLIEEGGSVGQSAQLRQKNLGLIEILVYFCYKFCLITSRLSMLAIFWYLFHEWLVLAVVAHVFVVYVCSLCFKGCVNDRQTNNNESREKMLKKNSKENGSQKKKEFDLIVDSSLTSTMAGSEDHVLNLENEPTSTTGMSSSSAADAAATTTSHRKKRSKLSRHLSLFIICLLSCVDLFMNQLSEIRHMKRVVVYYVLYFVQNCVLLTYWLVRSITSARLQLNDKIHTQIENSSSAAVSTPNSNTNNNEIFIQNKNSNFLFIVKSSLTTVSSSHLQSADLSAVNSSGSGGSHFSPNQYACYATLIYLFIMLFTIFGLILKFLHLHILRKRYRRL